MIYLSPLLLLLAGVSLDLLLILLNNTRDFARPTAAPMKNPQAFCLLRVGILRWQYIINT